MTTIKNKLYDINAHTALAFLVLICFSVRQYDPRVPVLSLCAF